MLPWFLVAMLALLAAWSLRPPPQRVQPEAHGAGMLAIGHFPATEDVLDWIPDVALELLSQLPIGQWRRFRNLSGGVREGRWM